MRKFRKKKGSTFIIVVFVTAIIFTTATTMIAVVTNDYKMRINESNKVENLYESDSGLDAVYNIIAKDGDMAVQYATNKVYADSQGIAVNYTDEQINQQFQSEFYNFMKNNLTSTKTDNIWYSNQNDGSSTVVTEADKTDKPLIYSIIKLKYYNTTSSSAVLSDLSSYALSGVQNAINVDDPNRTIKVKVTPNDTNKNIVVELYSTFKTATNTGTGYANTKTVKTKYTIAAPDYNKAVDRGTQVSLIPSQTVLKAIVADGNLSVNNTGKVTVDGDVWVKGGDLSYDSNSNYAYDKYKQGISLSNTNLKVIKTLTAEGNISTYGTFNLLNQATAEVTNLYAQNAYVGPVKPGNQSSNNNLIVDGSLVTNNDLTMNSTSSNITLNNYYGISDKDDKDSNGKPIGSTSDSVKAARESSSIIVNSDDTTNKITANSAYVHGLAYINTKTPYQTGESIAVKGNYVAYTTKLPGSTDDVQIVNYDPLWLLDYTATQTAADQKIQQFVDYFAQTNNAKDGGVSIKNLHAVGASVNNGTVTKNGLSTSDENVFTNEQNDYTRMVFGMGNFPSNVIASYSEVNANNTTNMLTVGQANNPQINFGAITKDFVEARSSYDNYGKLILINSGKEITIAGTKLTYNGQTYDLNNGSGQMEAVIITNGKVTIQGSTDFVGSIITSKNVDIGGSNTDNVSIKYDDLIVKGILAQYQGSWAKTGKYSDIYKTINGAADASITVADPTRLFKGEPLSTSVASGTVETQDYITLSTDGSVYDSSKYLKKGLWTLLKETGEVIDQK